MEAKKRKKSVGDSAEDTGDAESAKKAQDLESEKARKQEEEILRRAREQKAKLDEEQVSDDFR